MFGMIPTALNNITRGNTKNQLEACRNNFDRIALKVLVTRGETASNARKYLGVLGTLLSSEETRKLFLTGETLLIINNCYRELSESVEVCHFYRAIIREEDPRVREAVARGACTKIIFPKCDAACGSDEGYYCESCCVQQKAYRCLTCDKEAPLLYCETCWKRHHKGHECIEFFYPIRCATKSN